MAEESQAGRSLSLDELLILNQLWLNRRLTTVEAGQLIQKPEGDARARLERLMESGLVEPRGERKGRSYHLAASAYRRLGGGVAYLRQRGFEPIQQEQMVLQYVERHGSIARKEVSELCKVSQPQAYRLLHRLAKQGHLRQVGSRGRSVRYEKRHR